MPKKRIVVYTAGTWDCLHEGHLNIMDKSNKLGDYLIVGVNTDETVLKYKHRKPVYTTEQRVAIMKALKGVDKVVLQTIPDDIKMMKELKVDILTVGSDWEHRHDIEGLEWMRKNRKVVFIPYTPEVSSTVLRKRMMDNLVSKEGADDKIKDAFLIGKEIYLRELNEDDLDRWYRWFNDKEVTKYLIHSVFPNSREKQEQFLRKINTSSRMLQLGIIEKKSDELIGVVSIRDIDWIRRSGDIGIVIGEKRCWKRGLGLEAMGLMIHHAFTQV